MSQVHIVTYGETVQVGESEFRFVRTSKIITEKTSVKEIIDWLKKINVKNPDLTMVDFSLSEEE